MTRIARRSIHSGHNVERALSWHTGGGRAFFTRYANELKQAHKWCFIVGCNNSGTTLLQQLIEETADISTFPHEGQRYTNAVKIAEKRGHERVWSEYVDELRMTSASSQDCLPRLLHDWMRELPTPIREVILEKTTANAVRMPWLQASFPRSYFIGLVRNGYAVVEGIRRKGNKSVARGARHWNYVNKALLADSRQIDNFIWIKYEELAENPLKVAEKIIGFVGLESRKKGVKYDHAAAVPILSNVINMNEQSILQLEKHDKEIIRSEAGEMLDYFGY